MFNSILLKKKELKNFLIAFIDDETNDEQSFTDFQKFIESLDILQKWCDFLDLFSLLSVIIANHYRSINFYSKMEQILIFLKDKSKDFTPNQKLEVFNKTKNNRQLLIFLFRTKFLFFTELIQTDDQKLFQIILNDKDEKGIEYIFYLYSSIKPNMNIQEKRTFFYCFIINTL